MTVAGWNEELFCTGLTARLDRTLAGRPDALRWGAAVAGTAEAAEAVCAGRTVACGPGCPHCCVLNVAVLLPEALVVAGWLEERLPPSRLADLARELSRHRSSVRWMDDEERVAKKVSCPFLDPSGSCAVHPVRPLACRGVAALERGQCREALAPGYQEERPLVVADLLRRAAHDAAFRTLAGRIRERGLDDRSMELGSAVLAFLEDAGRRHLWVGGARLPDELWRA